MLSPFLLTFLVLVALLPFILRDRKQYKVILMAILVLLPFYQGFIYFRYMILLFVVLAFWQGDDRRLLQYRSEPINRVMMLFFVLSLISAFVSADITRAVTPVADLVFFYLVFLLCSVGIQRQLTTPLIPKILMWCLFGSVFIQTMQLYGFESFYIYDEAKLNMNTGLGFTNDDRVIRYWGPFGNSLTFSAYLSILGLFLFGYYHNGPQKRSRLLSYIILGVATYGVLLTAGRTAFAALVVALIVYSFLKSTRKAIVQIGGLVLLIVLFSAVLEQFLSGAALGMYHRFTNLGDDKSYRTETWIRALPILLANPVFGTGPGNLQTQIAPLISTIFVSDKNAMDLPWGHVENTYLSVLYTFGLSGFACFMYMVLRSLLYSVLAIKRTAQAHPATRQLAYGLTIAWVTILINMIANPVFVTDYRLIVLMLFFVAYAVQIGWASGRYGTKVAKPSVQHEADEPYLTQLA